MIETSTAFAARDLEFPRHAVAVTQPGSKLDQLAVEQQWLHRFAMYDWIGGRTSETSVVGLLPAALQNIDIDELLAGAGMMDEATRVRDIRKNPAALLALAWHAAGDGRGAKDMVVLPYKDRLLLFSRYLQQLIMESLGKGRDLDGNRVEQGIAVYGNKGSTDQHSYVQQLREGIDNFFVTFIEVLRDRAGAEVWVGDGVTAGDHLSGFFQGTRAALAESGRESLTITVDELSARSVGALIALFERAVGFYATLVNINAYHQPGVEAGKRAASAVLELQRQIIERLAANPGPTGIAELARQLGAEPETVYLTLRHLAANRRDIVLDGDPAQPAALLVRREANDD
jgi:glucose-6-phosphate isomerase